MESKSVLKGKIGLEIHAYVVTREKLFCACKASRERGIKPNIFICPICTGQAGAKPMLTNGDAVRKAVMIGLMLGCEIKEEYRWQRKHYDWPDMPKGYQNTISGKYAVPVGVDGKFFGVKIGSMHLEEDPASWEPSTGKVDYNRSGLPLVEIITEPDFVDGGEVVNWLRKLIHSLAYLKIVDKNAGIKVDVNVSIPGKSERIEVKNVSSIVDIGRAIDFELERQGEEGGKVRETRRFDSSNGKTVVMREKESGEDYRFIADPDLQDVIVDKEFIGNIEKKLPESPEEKLEKFVKKHGIGKKDAEVLAKHLDIAEFFEKVAEKVDAKFALSWVSVELLKNLNYHGKGLDEVDVDVGHFVELLKAVKSGKITELQGKQILMEFFKKGESFDISGGRVKGKIGGVGELEKVVGSVIKENGRAVADYKAGDEKALNFLIGKVMAKTEKRADFKVVSKILRKLLSKP